jgi:signal transduction histidine kinase
MEAGKLKLQRSVIDIKAKVEDVLRIVSHLIGNKQIESKVEIAPGVPRYIVGDKLRLRQILTNLISNAFKFTEKGTVTVRVTLETAQTFEEENSSQHITEGISSQEHSTPRSPKGSSNKKQSKVVAKYDQYIKFSITDTGIGIDPSIVHTLFKSFHQVWFQLRSSLSLSLSSHIFFSFLLLFAFCFINFSLLSTLICYFFFFD